MNQPYIFVDSYIKFSQLLNSILESDNKFLPIDLETNSLDFLTGRILLIQLKLGEDIYIIPVSKFDKGYIIGMFDFLNKKFTFIGHNIKFDMKFIIENYGITLERVYDTMITESILNMGIGKALYSLEELVRVYEGIELDKGIRTEFENHDGINFTEQQLIYSALDVMYLGSIYYHQMGKILGNELKATLDLECAVIPVMAEAEHNGVNFDQKEWMRLWELARVKVGPLEEKFKNDVIDKIIKVQKKRQFANLLEVTKEIKIPVKTKRDTLALEQITDIESSREWLTEHINIGSYLQVRAIFNNLFKIKVKDTDAKTLEKHRDHDIVSLLLQIRELEKKISTYGAKFLEENVHPRTQRIHTEFFQTGTVTGRFSSSGPNLQNIPREKEYRHCFISTPGWDLICADYAQQEMRIAAAYTNETKLIESFLTGVDVHTYTASVIFNKLPSEVTKNERYIGKTMNFAVLYGSTEFGLAYNLKVSVEQALDIIDKFYKGFPNLKNKKLWAEKKILENKYSSTMSGRKRYFEDKRFFPSPKEMNKYFDRMKREGFNQIIQGTGADAVKLALVLIRKYNPFGALLRILLTIHDEIICEALKAISKEAAIFVTDMMLKAEKIYLGEIPAAVEYAIDNIWEKESKESKERTL